MRDTFLDLSLQAISNAHVAILSSEAQSASAACYSDILFLDSLLPISFSIQHMASGVLLVLDWTCLAIDTDWHGLGPGVMAPLITITLVKTVSMSIYTKSKHTASDFIQDCFGFDVFQHVQKKGSFPNVYTLACFGVSGAVTGCAISAIACPFELAKLSAQVSVNLMRDSRNSPTRRKIAEAYQNKGTIATMRVICQNRGLLGLYTGYKLHICELQAVTKHACVKPGG